MRLVASISLLLPVLVSSFMARRFVDNSRQHLHGRGVGGALHQLRARKDWQDDINNKAYQNAEGGVGEAAAGALLGGLVLGPFGALFGAQLGAKAGAKNAVERARKEEMERLGISPDMLASAQDIGVALESSVEGLQASKTSLDTQQQLAKRLDSKSNDLYEKASQLIQNGKSEDEARSLLLERTRVQEKLKTTLQSCAVERKRMAQMEENVESLEIRAMEIESLLQRTVGASSSMSAFSLQDTDPLLDKFRDLGID